MENEFKKLGLSKEILDVLDSMNFSIPTEIQNKTIPTILKGEDVIGTSATGSGKTFAFACGIFEKVVHGKGVQALVLTPTRELAEQVSKVIRVFSRKSGLVVEDVFGGVSIDRQIRNLKSAEVVVGTPGRIIDHIERETIDFSNLKILILDEADRMVDMGFLPSVETILRNCPKEKQTLLFSATNSADVEYLEKKYMKSPKIFSVEKYVDASKLKQYFYDTPNEMKFSLLVHLLKNESSGIIMVFCNTRRNVDLVASNLKSYGVHAIAIHGGLQQNKRSKIIEKMHNNEVDVLVCTDVAARGLDIKGVSHVYNYDIPPTSEEYIHRIGRTARAGEEGMAVSIVCMRDYDNFRKVREDDSLKMEEMEVPTNIERLTPKFKDAGRGRFGGRGGRDFSRGGNRGRDSGRGGFKGGRRGSGGGRDFGGRRDSGSENFYRGGGSRRDNRRGSGGGRGRDDSRGGRRDNQRSDSRRNNPRDGGGRRRNFRKKN